MSYVDIGWPLGLMLIGGLTWWYSDGNALRVASVSIVYLFIGSRMGLGALKMWSEGRLKKEFPRYEYQKQRWLEAGKTNTALAMQLVIASIPSWLALHDVESFHIWLLLGAGLIFASWKMYHTLVYHTGAVPAEHYSVHKRPEYKTYQQTTNRFFPGPKKD